MIIGVDFDNTIVCYDGLFHKLAVEQGLIPADVAPAKNAVRDYLRQLGQEDRWTELQGRVYGPGMAHATLYPGVVEFFARCRTQGVEVFIISHRTRYPFLGERFDLHQAARDFLSLHGFNDPARIGLPADHIWFHESKVEKVARINFTRCTHFIDDLPEVLATTELSKHLVKVLFDPNNQHTDFAGMRRVESWAAVEEIVFGRVGQDCVAIAGPPVESRRAEHGGPALVSELVPPYDHSAISALLATAGLPGDFHVTPLSGGGNNRVFRIDREGPPLLLKSYFHHPDDPRDRLNAEFSFSRFAWDRGVHCVPQPLGRDDKNHMGLYEFVEGRSLAGGEIGSSEVDQAAAFFAAINRQKLDPSAAALAAASEACFTLHEHLDCIERRVQRLRRLNRRSRLDHVAADWLESKLAPAWFRVREAAKRQAAAFRFTLDEPLSAEDRCLSPSDFGFHNAIVGSDGRLRFLDFEYAGWDDPAKTVCDFLCQPRLPVAAELATRFTDAVLADRAEADLHRRRIEVLLPVYRVKWCCIMMNEFLPVASRRRSFALDIETDEQRKRLQLEKSDRALQCIAM